MPLNSASESGVDSPKQQLGRWIERLRHPGDWRLSTRLVALLMSLMIILSLLFGTISYSALSTTLNNQLDASVASANSRLINALANRDFGSSGSPDVPGTVTDQILFTGSFGFVTGLQALESGKLVDLPPADTEKLAHVEPDGEPRTIVLSSGTYRVIAVQKSPNRVFLSGLSTKPVDQARKSLGLTIIFVLLVCLVILGVAGAAIIRRNLRPLESLSKVATRVAQLPLDAGEVALSVRVPPSATRPGTEVGTVGLAFNAMLDNVSSALKARQRSETKVRRFVADASHELRTPLTAIRGYTEIMGMTEALTPNGKKSLDRVTAQSLRMTRLVEDLLLLARLDEGHQLTLSRIDLAPLILEAVSDVRVTARDHHWKFHVPDTPVWIMGDDGQLKQVMLNLLSNAAKHTPAETTVTTQLWQEPDGTAVVVVEDDGPGIDPGFVDIIFDRFSRADDSRTGTQGSTGLGLSIVQAMATAHGGSIAVESVPGRTAFILRFPTAPGRGQSSTPPRHELPPVEQD